ncbi:hypothetical protein JCM10207_006213 [Rhodosporidiobolus poonsookiae]
MVISSPDLLAAPTSSSTADLSMEEPQNGGEQGLEAVKNIEPTASSSAVDTSGISAPKPSLTSTSRTATASDDAPCCRICLDTEDEDAELGRLIVPCKCSGTARFVHELCLRSWRLADKKNEYYRCGTCGERYKLRRTVLTRALGAKHSVPVLTALALLFASFLAGFPADPALHWADYRLVGPGSKSSPLATVIQHAAPDGFTAAHVLRETTSTAGFLLGDCRWSSARVYSHFAMVYFVDVNGQKERRTEEEYSRQKKSRCGEAWGYGDDDAVPSRRVRAVMHAVKGLTVLGLVLALYGQLVSRICFVLFTPFAFLPRPAWLSRIPAPGGAKHLALVISSNLLLSVDRSAMTYWTKHARVAGHLFAPSQLILVFSSIAFTAWLLVYAHEWTGKASKWALTRAGAGTVVLDLREEGEKGGKEE